MMDRRDAGRLWLMTLVRLAGFALVLAGLGLAGSSAGAWGRLGPGLAMMAAGLGVFLIGPKLLLRRWRMDP